MRWFVLASLLLTASVASADSTYYRSRTVTVFRSAQEDADDMARTGVLRHRGCSSYEGVGFSTVSADHAIRNCCFWGQRKVREVAVARGPRGWFACVRYW
jgi:hypothetical protein